jgi:NADPH:quinone reductase-like Zn-dependent oxidoreductase
MKAAILTRYGAPENISVTEVSNPVPGPGEVLVRLHATAVNSGDARVRAVDVPAGMGLPFRLIMGWSAPRRPILGTEGAGVVSGLGAGAGRFAIGDEVVVFPGVRMGCHAEMMTIRETANIVPKPKSLSMVEAACMMFGGLTALDFLRRKAGAKPGDRVLVTGASGTVGSAGVQIAKVLGAEVTAVTSTANMRLVAGLGADAVVEYTKGPIPAPSKGYDIILDCIGSLPYPLGRPLLAKGGRLLKVWATLPEMLLAPVTGRNNGHRVIAGVSAENRDDMVTLAGWAEAGLYRPLIDSVTPLDAIVEAHRRASSGRKRGSAAVVFAAEAGQTPA